MILLMNTSIMTTEGTYTLRKITAATARQMIDDLDKAVPLAGPPAGSVFVWESAIGHEGAAQAMSLLLGFEVPVNRIQANQEVGQSAICIKMRGRVQEGQILDLETMEKVGYDLYEMKRMA